MNNSNSSFALFSSLRAVGKNLYFIGIGGVSMSGLAHLARARGFSVRGCDRDLTAESVRALQQVGVKTEPEDDAHPHGADLVVYSLAISETSPAITAARALRIPMISRAEFLSAVTSTFTHRIAVAGMHGKSTTVGMLASVFRHAGLTPTVLSGAPLTVGGMCHFIGGDDICIMEACEYRDSFLALRPTLSVITNIELDHPDYFPSMTEVEKSFSRFLWNSHAAVVGGDCPALDALADTSVLRFGFSEHCDLRGEKTPEGLRVCYRGTWLGILSLGVMGDYNAENALAAAAAALHMGISFSTVQEALAEFRGVGRRMEQIGYLPTSDGGTASVLLDYAHHPTEITCAISAARERGGRVLVVFQPHTYSRTRALWQGFISSLRLADYTVLTDIYAAREANLYGTSSSFLAKDADVDYAPNFKSAAAHLVSHAHSGDTVLILGAGDINRLAEHLPLQKNR